MPSFVYATTKLKIGIGLKKYEYRFKNVKILFSLQMLQKCCKNFDENDAAIQQVIVAIYAEVTFKLILNIVCPNVQIINLTGRTTR